MKNIDEMNLEEIRALLVEARVREEELTMTEKLEKALWKNVVDAMKEYCDYCDTSISVYVGEVEEVFGDYNFPIEKVTRIPGLIDLTTYEDY
jgi:hypothetical protein